MTEYEGGDLFIPKTKDYRKKRYAVQYYDPNSKSDTYKELISKSNGLVDPISLAENKSPCLHHMEEKSDDGRIKLFIGGVVSNESNILLGCLANLCKLLGNNIYLVKRLIYWNLMRILSSNPIVERFKSTSLATTNIEANSEIEFGTEVPISYFTNEWGKNKCEDEKDETERTRAIVQCPRCDYCGINIYHHFDKKHTLARKLFPNMEDSEDETD